MDIIAFDDLVVPGTPAQVPGNSRSQLRLRGLGVLVQERLGRHYESGCAETALQGAVFHERPLDGVQLGPVGQAFYGCHLVPIGLHAKGQARVNGLAIDDDGAGAAVAVAATFFGARQP